MSSCAYLPTPETQFFEATGLHVKKVWFGNPSFLKDSRFSLGFPFGLEEKATVKRIPQGGGRQAVQRIHLLYRIRIPADLLRYISWLQIRIPANLFNYCDTPIG
jgi:hypothetical protein